MTLKRSVCLVPALLLTAVAAVLGASPQAAPPDLSGDWILTTQVHGEPLNELLTLRVVDGEITGKNAGRDVKGEAKGDRVRFQYKDQDGTLNVYEGKLEKSGRLSGTLTISEEPWGKSPVMSWTARRPATDKPPVPRTLDFEPKQFHRVFSSTIEPVLRIWPGDTVRTTTVDAGGVDAAGKTRILGGNPQTGPFYVESAMPGDVLAVHVKKLRLNRPTAISDDSFVGRALTTDYASDHKQDFKDIVWELDIAKGVARPAKPTDRLKHLEVPVRPMLGCIGVAPGFGGAAVPTGDSGRVGGNMDFNEIVEGATVYLAVRQPGALLYVGDGHAVQGDGELNGNALETSLDVEFSVDVIKNLSIARPRIENDEYLMAMGLAGSLDEAFQEATSGLASWLEKDYGLTGPEAAILLGATIEYEISEVADRNAGVVAKVKKKYLPAPAPPKS